MTNEDTTGITDPLDFCGSVGMLVFVSSTLLGDKNTKANTVEDFIAKDITTP